MTEFNWSEFARVTKDGEHWPLLERAADLVGGPGEALDLGCGAGRDTRYLLARGWRVTAVDREPAAIALFADLPQENLRAVQSSFEDFVYEREKYDLVSAQFSLPFLPRFVFRGVFSRVKQAIKPRGLFAGNFFGVNDGWNTPDNDLTFLTREAVDRALEGLTVIELTQEERDGNTAWGTMKHWHEFQVIARKRG
jgi:SAM-dependent methyltransferase